MPTAIFLGGYDAMRLPELNYGVFASPWRAPLARLVLRHASLLLPVDEALMASENRYATWPEARPQGVLAHVPGLVTPYAVVPTGYDAEAWPMGAPERGRTVCTVAFVDSERTLRLKGIDILFEVAQRMPEVSFNVVGVLPGIHDPIARRFSVPPNVHLLPPRPRAELAAFYGAHAVYVQLSRSEGLPNVLCEAMLCGCVPVGSAVGGIPSVIGDTGCVVEVPDSEGIAAAVGRAGPHPPEADRG